MYGNKSGLLIDGVNKWVWGEENLTHWVQSSRGSSEIPFPAHEYLMGWFKCSSAWRWVWTFEVFSYPVISGFSKTEQRGTLLGSWKYIYIYIFFSFSFLERYRNRLTQSYVIRWLESLRKTRCFKQTLSVYIRIYYTVKNDHKSNRGGWGYSINYILIFN